MLQQNSMNILKVLMGNNSITVEDLKVKTDLSIRQIEYGLEIVNNWLFSQGFNNLIRERDGTLHFNNDVNGVLKIINKGEISYHLNEDERIALTYLYLYLNYEMVSMYHLIELLEVSRGTVQNDVKKLKESIGVLNLSIQYTRKNGYQLVGNERNIQEYMMKLIVEMITHDDIKEKYDLILSEFDLIDLNILKKQIVESMHENDKFLSENNLNIISYIFIFYSIREENTGKNSIEQIIEESKLDISSYEEHDMAKKIFERSKFNNDNHLMFLASLFLSYVSGNADINSRDFSQIEEIIDNILTTLKKTYTVVLNDYEKIFKQLYAHIRPVIYRILFQYPMINPLKDQVIAQYNPIYVIIKEIFSSSIENTGTKNLDDEISYLTIHFATFITRDLPKDSSLLNGIIVCPGGIGVSALLYQELSELFPNIHFFDSVSLSNLNEIVDAVDVIFSTTLIETNKPLFIVSPIMNNIEKINLVEDFNKKINKIESRRPFNIREILKIVEKYTDILDKEGLIYELTNFISSKDLTQANVKRRQPRLSELISENLIQLNVKANDWRDAIRKSAKPLLDNNKITENYIDAMIKNTEENGPYIVITKNVALPHARPEEGSLDVAIGITTLEKPINFGSKDNDPVKYIFCLSAIDNSSHLKGLAELVDLLDDKSFYKVMEQAEKPEEIINYIANKAEE